MAMKENSVKVFNYVKGANGKNITANDIAAGTGLTPQQVNAIVNFTFQKKGLMERVPAEIELADGAHKAVKFIRLTAEGKAFDPSKVPTEE